MIPENSQHGAMAWMTRHSVAANLLMLFLLVGGAIYSTQIKQEVFPDFELDIVTVSVPYPGASPSEVESGVLLAIEEAVRGIDGVKEVRSVAGEGNGSVVIELLVGADPNKALQDVQNEVERITSFPDDAEEPVFQVVSTRREVLSLMLYGDLDDMSLRNLAEQMRDELLQLPEVTLTEFSNAHAMEISIEIPQETLRAYNLTLREVAARIRTESVEVPGGGIKTRGGEILLRVDERREWGREFAQIPILTRDDGTVVRLGQIATVHDGFADDDLEVRFNGQPAQRIDVYRVGDQTPMEVSAAVQAYLKEVRPRLPAGVGVAIWFDRSEIYAQRVDLLLRNACMGLVLVLFLLGLFLEIRLAFWVMMGIPTSFLGSFLILPMLGVSINMVSLFAFIMSLGIVVDDAIVVGENIYKHRQQGDDLLTASIRATREIAVPVTFSILTNVVAFMPMFFVTGMAGKIFGMIPAVVISVFMISLVEALFILPAHLGHMRAAGNEGAFGRIHAMQQRISLLLERFIETVYAPFLMRCLRYRYVTVCIGVAVLLVVLGYVRSGRIATEFMPEVESDIVAVGVVLPYGSPVEETRAVLERLEAELTTTIEKNGGDRIVRGIYSTLGHAPRTRHMGARSGSHLAGVRVFLVPGDERQVTAGELRDAWRAAVGTVPGVESMIFSANIGGPSGGTPIDVQLKHSDMDVLEAASEELARELEKYAGAKDVDDGFSPGKPQINIRVRPEAQSVGLTASEIGRQLRDAYYGAEALRQQRGRNEVKVKVRYPYAERHAASSLDAMLLRTPQGGEIPLAVAAVLERSHAYTSIERINGRRVIHVTSDVDPRDQADAILAGLQEKNLPELMLRYPGLTYEMGGERKELGDAMGSLAVGFMLAVLAIYAMLAIPFQSYIQPVIIMTSIPFGIVGAVLGHVLMGYNLSIMSMMGVVALAGVVVNDSLVLIDFANVRSREGDLPLVAIATAGARRFRPIMLTSLTTFGGLAPMIFETSMQARFLIPMALSLGYGILFATVIALLLVPALYLIVEDIRTGAVRFWRRLWNSEPEME